MAYTIHVYLRSGDFSQEFADENHNGEETAENVRYEWEDEFRINGEFDKVEAVRDQTFPLSGEHPNEEFFSYDIPHVMVFEFHGTDGVTPLVVSEKALEEYVLDTNRRKLEIYLNDDEVVENPVSGVYIVQSDFPTELRD